MARDARTYPEWPILGVSVAVRHDDAVLLVKRGRPPYAGLWAFPGGRVEVGERLSEAGAREVREEAGIEVEIEAPIDMAEIIRRDEVDRVEAHYVLVVLAARYLSGTIRAGDDAAEARWVLGGERDSLNLTEDTARILAARGWR